MPTNNLLISEETLEWILNAEPEAVQDVRDTQSLPSASDVPGIVVMSRSTFSAMFAHWKACRTFPRAHVSRDLERRGEMTHFAIGLQSTVPLSDPTTAHANWDTMVRAYVGYLLKKKRLLWLYCGPV